MSLVPTTHSEYAYPSASTSQTCSGRRSTSAFTTATAEAVPRRAAAHSSRPQSTSVLDDVGALFPQRRQAGQHLRHRLRGVPLPALQLADDAQRGAGAVGLRGVAREPLVGHVRVVLEGT